MGLVQAVAKSTVQRIDLGFFNVRWYGAVGDGTTNDQVAFQAALNAGAGHSVFAPAGTYLVSGLTIPANTTLMGESQLNTVIKGLPGTIIGTLTPVITFSANCRVETLTVNANKAQRIIPATGGIPNFLGCGINLDTGADNGQIESIYLINSPKRGIQSYNVANLRVTGCTILDCVEQAVMLDSANTAQVSNCRMERCHDGVQWWGGDSAVVTNIGVWDVLVSNCVVKDSTTSDGRAGAGIWGSLGERCVVTGCTVENMPDVGIDFEGCINCSAVGNVIKECKAGALTMFYGGYNNTFAANIVDQRNIVDQAGDQNVYGAGIYFYGTRAYTDMLVVDNIIHTNNSCGIYADQQVITKSQYLGNKIRQSNNSILPGISLLDGSEMLIANNQIYVSQNRGIALEGISDSTITDNQIICANNNNNIGIHVYWRSNDYPAQRNDIKNNTIRGFSRSIDDDSWGGTKLSHNWIANNRVSTIYRRNVPEWVGKVENNVSVTNPNTTINPTPY